MDLQDYSDAELETGVALLEHEIKHRTIPLPFIKDDGSVGIAVPTVANNEITNAMRADLKLMYWEQASRRLNKALDYYTNDTPRHATPRNFDDIEHLTKEDE